MTTIEAPTEVIEQAETLLADLPRKEWPEDSFSVATDWSLETYTDIAAGNGRCAFICYTGHVEPNTDRVARRWIGVE